MWSKFTNWLKAQQTSTIVDFEENMKIKFEISSDKKHVKKKIGNAKQQTHQLSVTLTAHQGVQLLRVRIHHIINIHPPSAYQQKIQCTLNNNNSAKFLTHPKRVL